MRGDIINIIIANTSELPIYEQIIRQIKDSILMGELKESELMPSIRNLAKELQISVITTKRAYDELEKEGFITTVPGKGSFVAAQSKSLLKETRMKILEEKLMEAILCARSAEISLSELHEMINILCQEV